MEHKIERYKKKLKAKMEYRFAKKPKYRMIIKLKRSRLIIEYMYGAKYSIQKKVPKKPIRTLNIMANADKIVEIVVQEKLSEKGGSIYNKLRRK